MRFPAVYKQFTYKLSVEKNTFLKYVIFVPTDVVAQLLQIVKHCHGNAHRTN